MAARRGGLDEWRIMLALFLASTTVYFLSTCGLFGSNPGSHYALTKAIVENRSFVINSFARYTGFIDYSRFGDDMYSDRAPGMAFATTPFYLAGKIAASVIQLPAYYGGWDIGSPEVFSSLFLPLISGGLSVVLLYRICRILGGSVYASSAASLTLAFGTILWKYSTTLYSHGFSAFLLLASLHLALSIKSVRKEGALASAMFFAMGYLVLTEYANMLLVLAMLAYLHFAGKLTLSEVLTFRREYMQPLLLLGLPILAIPAYNLINFGNPFTNAYAYSPHHPWVGDLGESLTTPLAEGLPAVLWDSSELDGGIFYITPALFLSLWGFAYLYRGSRKEALLLAALFLTHLLFYSKYKTYWGGGTRDTRYLLTVIPLMVAPLSAWVDGFLLKQKQPARKIFEAAMWLLIIVSFIRAMDDVGTFEGHGTRTFNFPPKTMQDFWTGMGNVFPNARNLPFFAGAALVAYAAASFTLKRTPGVELKDRNLKSTAAFTAAVGILLIILFRGQPVEPMKLGSWSYSTDGVNWVKGGLPFNVNSPRLLVKGVVEVGSANNAVLIAAAKDCIKEIYVNDRHVFSKYGNSECRPCLHCRGGEIDMGKAADPGLNTVLFEITGLGNVTQFDAGTP